MVDHYVSFEGRDRDFHLDVMPIQMAGLQNVFKYFYMISTIMYLKSLVNNLKKHFESIYLIL